MSVLTSDRIVSHGTMDELKDAAKALGVAVRTEGYLPHDTAVEELTVAAGRECVTNCIKHAGGDEVQIRIAERNELYDITITNGGIPPTYKIREGSVQLVLMDVQTQHKHSGLAAAERIKKAFQQIKIVIVTSLVDP